MKMNKKGAFGFQAFLTKAFIIGVLYFVFITVFGVGGGFKAAFDIGKFVSEIPVVVWVLLSVFWLFSQIRGR